MKKLGSSDLEITRIGIGAWAMGGSGWAFAWGKQDDSASVAAIHAGLDAGMNWIDTAAVYGLGHSEEVVADALRGMSPKPLIFTKCSRVPTAKGEIGSSLKRASIRSECEGSLHRLGIECIDLYQMHWPQPEEDIEEGWAAMEELRQEGKVRHIGVSNFNVPQLKRALSIAPVTSLQPPYSLARRDVDSEVLPFCQDQGIGVIAYSPMASGLLTGKMTRQRAATLPADDWRSRSPFFHEPLLTRNLQIAAQLGEVGARHSRSTAGAALAWVLHHPAVTGAIVGLRNADQVEDVREALDFRLTDQEYGELTSAAG